MKKTFITILLIALAVYFGVKSGESDKAPDTQPSTGRVQGIRITNAPIAVTVASATSTVATTSIAMASSSPSVATSTPVKKAVAPAPAKPKPAPAKPAPKTYTTASSKVVWTSAALLELNKIPRNIRPSVKKKITDYATKHGIKTITKQVYDSIHI